MAANLSGMFGQLNNVINQNPMAQGGVGTGLLNQTFASGGSLLGSMTGNDPYGYMAQPAKQVYGQEQLGEIENLGTSDGLKRAAEIYGKMGDQAKQVSMAQAAQQQLIVEQEYARTQKTRETLAAQANKLGFYDMAKNIADGDADLDEAQKFLRDKTEEKIALTKGLAGKKAVAKMHGISEEQFKELGMGNWNDAQFEDWRKGSESEVKAYSDAKGNNIVLQTSKGGLVKDPKSGNWVNPSDLGLAPSVNYQKILNVSNKMVEQLGIKSIDNFEKLYEAANNAQGIIDNIETVMPLIDEMPTGLGADAALLAYRIADRLGLEVDPKNILSAETYLAMGAERVKNEVKAFGSGTSITDADREYTAFMTAATLSGKAESLKRLLTIRKNAAETTQSHFYKVKGAVKKRLGSEGAIVDDFIIRSPVKRTDEQPAEQETPSKPFRTYNPDTGTFS
jgi:hypothetical protein